MGATVFACDPRELSCLIGNLFSSIEPPCGCARTANLTLCGTTHSGRKGRLVVMADRCAFYGERADLDAVRNARCIERRCDHDGG